MDVRSVRDLAKRKEVDCEMLTMIANTRMHEAGRSLD